MSIPSKTELERLFDAESADDVRFIETVASWPSLRILDFLYLEGHSSTGDIARELNMDMREVKDRLEALEEFDVVTKTEDRWATTTDKISITLKESNGIDISYSLKEPAPVSDSHSKKGDDTEKQTEGFLGRVRQTVESLFG